MNLLAHRSVHRRTEYAFWIERSNSVNWLRMRQVTSRGATLGAVNNVRQLVSTGSPYGLMELKRSNSADATDFFRAFAFPVPAVNPSSSKANHLYVAYADKGTNTNDRADVFLVVSTDGGASWTSPVRVNGDATLNDQWMPVLAVKPDGTKLFLGWYDRRHDSNNSLIDFYGRFGTIASNGGVTLGTEFKISTTSSPPVFAGTLPANTANGRYDPVYPPGGVNLAWYGWPVVDEFEAPVPTADSWRNHVGEYDGAWADGPYVYVTWTDNRRSTEGTIFARNQRDIRLVRLTWPQ